MTAGLTAEHGAQACAQCVCAPDWGGWTALHYAASGDKAEAAAALVGVGATLLADGDGWTPLHVGCLNGAATVVPTTPHPHSPLRSGTYTSHTERPPPTGARLRCGRVCAQVGQLLSVATPATVRRRTADGESAADIARKHSECAPGASLALAPHATTLTSPQPQL